MKALLLAGTTVAALAAATLSPAMAQATKPVSQVVQWNRTLLVIVRTPGAQPATIHPTRSFAILHGAIYDAVNAIDGTHKPYLIRVDASHSASQEAAAAAAAHESLVKLYPNFQATLDAQFQQALAQIPNTGKAEGITIGNTVADRILALRDNDGSSAQPIPYVFGNAPGDYQSTPPNFPKQPQFTHWSRVTPFALESANQFRPGGPPVLATKSNHWGSPAARPPPRTRHLPAGFGTGPFRTTGTRSLRLHRWRIIRRPRRTPGCLRCLI
jgi:hypothetical protein